MADELNVTYITFAGHVDLPTYRCVYFLVMFTVYVLIICFNVTIVSLICVHQNLHEPMYVFIAALLLNSLLYSSTVYPKLLLDVLSDTQLVSYSLCLLQFHMFYSLGGSEFLLLAAMAYDRYVSVCRPLLYRAVMRRGTVSLLLVLAWLLPAAQISVLTTLSADMKLCSLTLKGIFCNNSIYSLHCVSSKALSVLGVVALTVTALLPLLFIVFTYTRILVISFHSGRSVRSKAANTCLPHLLVLLSFSVLSVFDVTLARVGSDLSKTAHLVMTLQTVVYHPMFNPIIYGVKMKEISKHLKRFLS